MDDYGDEYNKSLDKSIKNGTNSQASNGLNVSMNSNQSN